MPRPPFDHFSFIAPLYERLAQALDVSDLQARLNLPAEGLLLDAGGGTGRVAYALRDAVAGTVVLDYSSGMIRRAARKPGLWAVRGVSEALPFADHAFARIVVVDAFHHFHEHEVAVRELWRVLAPGGRLVIEEPNIERPAVKLVALFEKVLLMRSRFYAPGTIGRMFAALGGEVQVDTDHRFNAWIIVDKPA